jgi:hypothetical protein
VELKVKMSVDEQKVEEVVGIADVIIAVREYDNKEEERWERGRDITASPADKDDRILMRVITNPSSKSGTIGTTAIREMSRELESKDFDKGVLIGKRFTKEARSILRQEGIEVVSEKIRPSFKPQRLYGAIHKCLEELCLDKCGKVPEKKSDCKGYLDDGYQCKVRLVSDNAQFHFERDWMNLLQNDLKELLAISKS